MNASARVLVMAVTFVALSGCGEDLPSFYSVTLAYRGPAPGSIPPATIEDGSCYHHYAPSNLMVSTSWGAQARLERAGPDTFSSTFTNVPAGMDLWVSFIDITLCPTGKVGVTRGVTANGVALIRVDEVGGQSRLAFRLDRSGKVIP